MGHQAEWWGPNVWALYKGMVRGGCALQGQASETGREKGTDKQASGRAWALMQETGFQRGGKLCNQRGQL